PGTSVEPLAQFETRNSPGPGTSAPAQRDIISCPLERPHSHSSLQRAYRVLNGESRMRRWVVSCLVAGMAWVPAGAAPPLLQQSHRRDRMFPELVVESGGRRGSCDVLTFTRDGKHLLAAGDDKVVRVWAYRDGRVDSASMKVLRWSVWREQRGAIYALAVSPDAEGRRVAVGGLGPYPTSAAVFDRRTGEILH